MPARRLPASHRPWPCAILAVDPGEPVSGWALFAQGAHVELGVGSAFVFAEVTLAYARKFADEHRLPLRVVIETWTQGPRSRDPKMRAATMRWLSEIAGIWKVAARQHRVAKAHIVRVNVATWRAAITRPRFGTSTEQHHELERQAAIGISGMDVGSQHDQAAAICIAKWASHAGEVGKTLPRKTRVAYGIEGAR